MFELYSTADGQHYSQFIYRKPGVEHPEPVNIPGLGQKWTLKQFKTVFEPIIPSADYDEECRV